ncbi:hypothetical protein ACFYY8_25100 [Streptosporangium sp. NPDC001559]|uniref:hypothetical protein n=1 Tax=Streptosporangium sp. NPDC001559 TaxID=3366187 RepID=UPI0036E1205F
MGFVIGTIGGGLITSGLNWRWTMLILFGIGVLVMLGAITVVRETTVPVRTRLDVPGAILASGGLFALVYGVSAPRDPPVPHSGAQSHVLRPEPGPA